MPQPGVDLSPCLPAIERQIEALCDLTLGPEELAYLEGIDYFQPDFIAFLRLFRLKRDFVQLRAAPFELTVAGPWLHTILFEVPLLAIINESWFRHRYPGWDLTPYREAMAP